MQEDSPLYNAREELKRCSHSINVTLKYTRTCDVIKTIILKYISSFDQAMISLFEHLHSQDKIKDIPLTPLSRAEILKKHFNRDLELRGFIDFYLLLKKIDRAEYTKREEFRKNVTLVVMQNDEVLEVSVPTLFEYYEKTREFLDYLDNKFF